MSQYGFRPGEIDRRVKALVERERGVNANPVTVRWVKPNPPASPRPKRGRYSSKRSQP